MITLAISLYQRNTLLKMSPAVKIFEAKYGVNVRNKYGIKHC